jgi:heat shock protein HslJ
MRTLRPMRTLPLLLLAAAALLAPGQALAGASASTTPSRYFAITGLVLGNQKYEASGKIALEGDRLMSSVGCNSIGGQVSVDGDVVTVGDGLAMTQMACEAVTNEDVFVKILDHGPFRITTDAWVGTDAEILVEELDVPAPGRTLPPDQPVGSSPGAVDPGASCPPIPIDPGFGGGRTGGSTGSTGGATGSGGSTGSSGGSSGENPSGTAEGGPVEVPPATPAGAPGGTPGATSSGDPGIVPPAPPPPDQTPGLDQAPEPSLVTVGPAASEIAAPDPGTGAGPGIGTDPGIGKPPVDGPCPGYVANDDVTSGSGASAVPPQADTLAAAEHDKSASMSPAAIAAPVLGGLALFAGLGFLAFRRRRAIRPETEVDASP